MNVVLFQPEIPANTGNIIRLCANTGSTLSLISPLGFVLDDRRLLRAGLDYHEFVNIRAYDSLKECLEAMPSGARVYAATSKGHAYPEAARFGPDDVLVFGRETTGLPDDFVASLPEECRIRIPMVPGSRCYNLANSVAIMLYEAWRQNGFAGCREN
ncbi:MAG: tRNA (cytidine(34)-2'-O)-methyltransferase [Succinivibrionaceae bacterium]|nr:tRNA (cytidine(34)-2'-O)-methyltransferase [Succinivibrionaceae bacterium]